MRPHQPTPTPHMKGDNQRQRETRPLQSPRRRPHQPTPTPHIKGDNRRQWETTGDKTTSEPKKPTTPTNTKAARSNVALRIPTVNCLGKNLKRTRFERKQVLQQRCSHQTCYGAGGGTYNHLERLNWNSKRIYDCMEKTIGSRNSKTSTQKAKTKTVTIAYTQALKYFSLVYMANDLRGPAWTPMPTRIRSTANLMPRRLQPDAQTRCPDRTDLCLGAWGEFPWFPKNTLLQKCGTVTISRKVSATRVYPREPHRHLKAFCPLVAWTWAPEISKRSLYCFCQFGSPRGVGVDWTSLLFYIS